MYGLGVVIGVLVFQIIIFVKESLMMNKLLSACRLFFLVILFFNLACAAEDVVFSVNVTKDRLSSGSALSSSGEYFSKKGSEQVGIYKRDPYKRLGAVCCHRGEVAGEFFLISQKLGDVLLQLKQTKKEGGRSATASIFSVEGTELFEIKIGTDFQEEMISIAPDKKYFSLYFRDMFFVYDSDLKPVHKFQWKSDLGSIESFTLSLGGSSALVQTNKSFVYIDFHEAIQVNLPGCNKVKLMGVSVFSGTGVDEEFFVASDTGSSCVVRKGKSKNVKLDYFGEVLGGYVSQSGIYIVTQSHIYLFENKTLTKNASFDLYDFYMKKYGKPSPYEKVMFSSFEFDEGDEMFYLRGHSSIASFFEIGVSKK